MHFVCLKLGGDNFVETIQKVLVRDIKIKDPGIVGVPRSTVGDDIKLTVDIWKPCLW